MEAMTTALAPHRGAPARGTTAVPWSPRAWGQALYLAGGIPAQLAALAIALVPWWPLSTPSWGDVLGHHWGKLWPGPLLAW